MQDLCWDCRVCEACGVCGRSEAECKIYHEYYELKDGQYSKKDAGSASVAVLEKKETKVLNTVQWSIEANMGLINRLSGCLISVVEGDEMALLTIKVGEKMVSSMMPLHKFKESGKKEGDIVTLVFKASSVRLMK